MFKKTTHILLAVHLLCFALASHGSIKTDKSVFAQMLAMGMPVGQAVAGVLTNSPNSATAIVEQALTEHPQKVFAITRAGLKAVPEQKAQIVAVAIKHNSQQSADILSAVANEAPGFTSKTVEMLVAHNPSQKAAFISQAANALRLVQLQRIKPDEEMQKLMQQL